MCPTPIGRIHTRVAILVLPAILGTILSIVTGRPDWIVLIGVYLLMGVALDACVYSWILKYQPPWMTGVLGVVEFGLLYVLAQLLELDLSPLEAIVFYWVSWILATLTRIVALPIFSLTYIESAGEFRRIAWSLPEAQAPLPVLAVAEGGPAGEVVRAASGVNAVPLEKLPSPSGAHAIPGREAAVGEPR